ncbi:MAG: hypothetical protein R2932_29365 [Caldilineaceae bacterium]
MALFITVALTSSAVVAGTAVARKSKQSTLVGILIDGKPKQATLLPSKTQQVLRRQQLAQDLFGDTRQQQLALNTDHVDAAQQQLIAQQKENLIIASTGLGLAAIGAVVAPVFYLPSVLCILYTNAFSFH